MIQHRGKVKRLYIGYLSSFVHKYVYSYLSRRKERDDQRPRTTLTLLYSNNFSEGVNQTDPCALRHPGCAPSAEHPLAHACAPQGLGTHGRAERCHVLRTMQWLPREVHWSDWTLPETPASRTLETGYPVDLSKAEWLTTILSPSTVVSWRAGTFSAPWTHWTKRRELCLQCTLHC